MTYFLRVCLGLALGAAGRPTVGQHAPERATFVGLVGGFGMAFTPSYPSNLDMDGACIKEVKAAANRIGSVVLLGAFLRVQQGAWFAQPELRYQNVSSAPFAVSGGGGGGGFFSGPPTERFHVRQLTSSLVGGYRFGSHQQYYGLLGPALAWRWGTDEVPVPTPLQSKSDNLPYAVDQAPTARQLQLHSAIGRWGQHFGVEARFVYGLTPLVQRLTVQEQTYDFRIDSRLLVFSLGYRFGRVYRKH